MIAWLYNFVIFPFLFSIYSVFTKEILLHNISLFEFNSEVILIWKHIINFNLKTNISKMVFSFFLFDKTQVLI